MVLISPSPSAWRLSSHLALNSATTVTCPSQAYDATVLAASYSGPRLDILIDQGRDDNFLSAGQLLPDNLIAVCSKKDIPVVFRLHEVSSCVKGKSPQ